jgi:protein SCO1/2
MFRQSFIFGSIITIINIFFLTISLSHAHAISNTADVKEIGVKERLGDYVPQDLTFKDEDGNIVQLRDYFQGEKPVILTPVYYECPRLCGFILNGVLDVVNNLNSLTLGKDFKIVSVSFNPDETPGLAKAKAANFHKALEKQQSAEFDWHFLTGNAQNISKLTEVLGFNYKRDGEEFAHSAVLVVLTPQGKISRYLYGVQYSPKDVKLSLLEASDGKMGSSKVLNKVLLYCYEFDPVGRRYALQALNVVKVGGVITLLSLAGFLTYLWKKEKKKSSNSDGGLKG